MRYALIAICFLLLAVFNGYYSYQKGWDNLTHQLGQQLQNELLPKLYGADGHRLGQYDFDNHQIETINRDLRNIPVTGVLPLFTSCSAEVSNANDDTPARQIEIKTAKETINFSVSCVTNDANVAIGAALSATLTTALLLLIPIPLSTRRRRWISTSKQTLTAAIAFNMHNYRAQIADLLTELGDDAQSHHWTELATLAAQKRHLSDHHLAWLRVALTRVDGTLTQAFEVADANKYLIFDMKKQNVILHGITIPLAQTPFFYYAWYALQTCNADAGYTNPATNRPADGNDLADFMERWGGHSKAINDLRAQGLKAKTMDQNRSKVKEEIVAMVGETLANDFLFEQQRDLKTGRSRYKLALPAKNIRFIPELEISQGGK